MAFNPEQSAILKTISHFDVLNIPLTLIEITRFSRLELTAQKTLELLNSQPLNQLISQKNGLYFLNERLEILTLKHERYRLALSKLKRAKISAHLLSRLPWIRAVAIYSSLAFKNSRTDGDIDLFFITAGNRVWSARFFVNSLLTVFNLRPKNNNTKNKLCTSYFVDENNLDLSCFNETDDNYYYYCGPASFVFLAGNSQTISNFYQSNNWIKNTLPNWQPISSTLHRPTNLPNQCQVMIEKILGLIAEKKYRDLQIRLMPKQYRDLENNKNISLSASAIKMHRNDKRQKFNQLFEENFKRILNSNYEKNP